MKKNEILPEDNKLFLQISSLIENARKQVHVAVNVAMVRTYYEIGRVIVEDEQQGNERAQHGKAILKQISKRLSERFGRGFSIDNLENMRKFYLVYSKSETPSRISDFLEQNLRNMRKFFVLYSSSKEQIGRHCLPNLLNSCFHGHII